jgi:hypothetical protein
MGCHNALRCNEMGHSASIVNCADSIVKNTDRLVKAALQVESIEYYLCSRDAQQQSGCGCSIFVGGLSAPVSRKFFLTR